MPNIFLCLPKGLFTFIILIGAIFILTRQIQEYVKTSLAVCQLSENSKLLDYMLTIFKANYKKLLVFIFKVSLFNIFKNYLLQSLLDRVPYGEGQVQDLSLTFGESDLIDIHETVSLCLRRELHAVSEQVIFIKKVFSL